MVETTMVVKSNTIADMRWRKMYAEMRVAQLHQWRKQIEYFTQLKLMNNNKELRQYDKR